MRAWGPVPLGLEPSRQDDPTAQRRQRHERVGDQEGPSDRVAPHLRPLVFFGALDPGKLSFAERSLRKLPAARAMLPEGDFRDWAEIETWPADRKSTRLNSSHEWISYAVFCLKKKHKKQAALLLEKNGRRAHRLGVRYLHG